jgi:hypothetical protein
VIIVMDKPIPVVPDLGTAKAAQLAAEITGNPGRWVRLDCQHIRHIQQPPPAGYLLECPTCPPSTTGTLAHRHVLGELPDHRLIALPAAEPVASSTARRLAAQALAPDLPKRLVGQLEQVTAELVPNAVRHTQASRS